MFTSFAGLADGKVYAVGTARLLVESGREQPDAPVELQCKAESSRMISVSWRGPSRTDVKAYTVHYTAAGIHKILLLPTCCDFALYLFLGLRKT